MPSLQTRLGPLQYSISGARRGVVLGFSHWAKLAQRSSGFVIMSTSPYLSSAKAYFLVLKGIDVSISCFKVSRHF